MASGSFVEPPALAPSYSTRTQYSAHRYEPVGTGRSFAQHTVENEVDHREHAQLYAHTVDDYSATRSVVYVPQSRLQSNLVNGELTHERRLADEEDEDEEEGIEKDEEEVEDGEEGVAGDEDDEDFLSEASSIPDSNIDFDLVYALRTFVATVEGQASVVRGDELTLLDDSNSYWWLVKVLKTEQVGYIPAENIETPFERLARLNKYLNVEVTSLANNADIINNPPPRYVKRKTVTMSKGVYFRSQTIIPANSDDEDDEEYEDEEYEDWVGDMKEYDGSGGESEEEMDEEDEEQAIQIEADEEEEMEEDIEEAEKGDQTAVTASEEVQVDASDKASSPVVLPTFTVGPIAEMSRERALAASAIHHEEDIAPTSFTELPLSLTLEVTPTASTTKTSADSQVASKSKGDGARATFKRLFARNIRPKPTSSTSQQSTNSVLSTGSAADDIASSSSGSLESSRDADTAQASEAQSQPQHTQLTVLRVFAGNLNLGATFKTVLVNPQMNAAELVQQAVSRFHIAEIESSTKSEPKGGIVEYYLTVKATDGEEYTLAPQDHPLSIFQTLTISRNTPLPSFTHVSKSPQGSSKFEVTRVGVHLKNSVSDIRFGEDSIIKFFLRRKVKRVDNVTDNIFIKISLFPEDMEVAQEDVKADNAQRSGRSKSKRKTKPAAEQERIDKIVAVRSNATIADITTVALDKFHIVNGVVDGDEQGEKLAANAARASEASTGPQMAVTRYRLHVLQQGKETPTELQDSVMAIFGNVPPPMSSPITDRPEKAIIREDITFVLRRTDHVDALSVLHPSSNETDHGQTPSFEKVTPERPKIPRKNTGAMQPTTNAAIDTQMPSLVPVPPNKSNAKNDPDFPDLADLRVLITDGIDYLQAQERNEHGWKEETQDLRVGGMAGFSTSNTNTTQEFHSPAVKKQSVVLPKSRTPSSDAAQKASRLETLEQALQNSITAFSSTPDVDL